MGCRRREHINEKGPVSNEVQGIEYHMAKLLQNLQTEKQEKLILNTVAKNKLGLISLPKLTWTARTQLIFRFSLEHIITAMVKAKLLNISL